MDQSGKTEPDTPQSLQILQSVKTSADFAAGMSALMGDLIAGRVTPQVGNAVCNAGGKLLKMKDMEMRHGTKGQGPDRELMLVDERRLSARPAELAARAASAA